MSYFHNFDLTRHGLKLKTFYDYLRLTTISLFGLTISLATHTFRIHLLFFARSLPYFGVTVKTMTTTKRKPPQSGACGGCV